MSYDLFDNFGIKILGISLKFRANFEKNSYEILTKIKYASEIFMNAYWTSYKLFTNFEKFLMNFFWTSDEFNTNFEIISDEFVMKTLWTSCELLTNGLRVSS